MSKESEGRLMFGTLEEHNKRLEKHDEHIESLIKQVQRIDIEATRLLNVDNALAERLKAIVRERLEMINLIKDTVLQVDDIKGAVEALVPFLQDLYTEIIEGIKWTPKTTELSQRLESVEDTVREWFDPGYDESNIERRLEAASEKGESYAKSAMVRLSGFPSSEWENTVVAKGGILPRLASLEQKANALRLRSNELRELGIMIDDIRHRDLFTKEIGEVKEKMAWLEAQMRQYEMRSEKTTSEQPEPKKRRRWWWFW